MLLNLTRAKEYMKEAGVDLLVATSPVNVAYLTGFDCFSYRTFKEYMMAGGQSNRFLKSFGLLALDGRPALVTSASNVSWTFGLDLQLFPYGASLVVTNPDRPAPRDRRFAKLLEAQLRPMEKYSIEGLVSAIKSLGLDEMTLGLEFDTMDEESIARIRKGLPKAKVGDATETLRLIRMVKTPEEIWLMRKAADANEHALSSCMKVLKPGTPWAKVKDSYLTSLAEMQAYPEHYLYSANGLDVTDYGGTKVRSGDVGFIDMGCTYDRYLADTGAAFYVGRWARDATELYEGLRAQLEDAADRLAPGVGSLDIFNALRDFATKRGMKFIQHGHALGLEPREHPVIMDLPNRTISDDFVSVNSNIPLEENMVLNIETPYYSLNTASYNLEQTFVITKKGARLLRSQDRSKPFGV